MAVKFKTLNDDGVEQYVEIAVNPYTSCTGILTQSGTSDPVVTIDANNLVTDEGTPIELSFTRGNVGQYYIAFSETVAIELVRVFHGDSSSSNATVQDCTVKMYVDTSTIAIECKDANGDFTDGGLSMVPFEVRIVPTPTP